MKKKIISFMLALSMVMACVPSVNAKAAEKPMHQLEEETAENDWINEMLEHYEPYLELKKEYPEISKVYSKTEYVLSEMTADKNGNIVKTNNTKFSNLEEMREEHIQKEAKSGVSYGARAVMPGQLSYKTYAEIQIGIALMQYADGSYFVAFLYDWLTMPEFNLVTRCDAAVALALDSGMTMEGSSYEGLVVIEDVSGEPEEFSTENERLSVKASSANAIGYNFRVSYMPTDIYGLISCNAYKNEKDIDYCSVFGEYDTIKFSLNPSNFSVSYPAGLSFGFGTSRDRYTIQEALYIGGKPGIMIASN